VVLASVLNAPGFKYEMAAWPVGPFKAPTWAAYHGGAVGISTNVTKPHRLKRSTQFREATLSEPTGPPFGCNCLYRIFH